MQRGGSRHRRPKARKQYRRGRKSFLCSFSASPLSLSETDIKRRAKRAYQKQVSQTMRGENSRLSVEYETGPGCQVRRVNGYRLVVQGGTLVAGARREGRDGAGVVGSCGLVAKK
eukprot:5008920-Pleurochrysis_carterae.AAC.1